MTDPVTSPSQFEISVKGDSACIREFFAGLRDVVEQQTRSQVIVAEAVRDLVPALSTSLVKFVDGGTSPTSTDKLTDATPVTMAAEVTTGAADSQPQGIDMS